MNRMVSLILGLLFVGVGLLALVLNLGGWLPDYGMLGLAAAFGWPLIVVGIGLAFVLAPMVFYHNKALSGLYIPGVPILVTGLLLWLAYATDNWALWGVFWPFEVLGVALAFVLAAAGMRIIWLLIPAIWVGFNGGALLLTSLTGHWEWWAILWVVEVLCVALTLYVTALGVHGSARGVLATIGSFFFLGTLLLGGLMGLLLLPGAQVLSFLLPACLILSGVWLLARGLLRGKRANRPDPAS